MGANRHFFFGPLKKAGYSVEESMRTTVVVLLEKRDYRSAKKSGTTVVENRD